MSWSDEKKLLSRADAFSAKFRLIITNKQFYFYCGNMVNVTLHIVVWSYGWLEDYSNKVAECSIPIYVGLLLGPTSVRHMLAMKKE